MASTSKASIVSIKSVRFIFSVSVLILLFSSFVPDLRLWGVSVWSFQPLWVKAIFTIIGAVILAIEYALSTRIDQSGNNAGEASRSFLPYAIFVFILYGIFFYLLRAKTHFLGDGYTLLAELSKENSLVKTRGLGEGLLHVWVKDIVGSGETAALASYQIISIGAGLIFAAITLLCSGLIFARLSERLLFALGVLSGGYLLLFFGYAENYALFSVSVLGVVLVGLLSMRGKAGRWWILLPLSLAIFFHVLGLMLIPGALFTLLRGSAVWQRYAKLPSSQKVTLAIVPVLIGLTAVVYLYTTNVYFRFAFVPFVADQFTVGHYTLLSLQHLGDIANLLFLLVPGWLMFLLFVRKNRTKETQTRDSSIFLWLMAGCSFLAVSTLDPKLGMPRDWDLFSFAGIPITALLFWLILTSSNTVKIRLSVAVLAIGLGILSLAPRVLMQADPAVSVPTFSTYLHLDPQRSRTGMFLLATYHLKQGDTTSAVAVENQRRTMFPGEQLLMQAKLAGQQGRLYDSKSYTLMALRQNAGYADAWLSLAMCYDAEQKWDSALIAAQTADGLNPYNSVIRNQIALAYLGLDRTDEAKAIWEELGANDTTLFQPPLNLSRIAKSKGEMDRYEELLTRAASRASAPAGVVKELADLYLRKGSLNMAAIQYRKAIQKGLDSVVVTEILNKNPQLRAIMQPGAK